MKLFDCFTFYNELDLLEIRLNELYDTIDYFILSESTITHSGDPKPLYYKENKERYLKWADKIIHIIVDDAPPPGLSFQKLNLEKICHLDARFGFGRWKTERYQRNQLVKGLTDCKSDDIILVSDIDEIPNPKKIDEAKQIISKHGYTLFLQKLYYYYLNGYVNDNWQGTVGCNFGSFQKLFNSKPDNVRRLANMNIKLMQKFNIKKCTIINTGGWHFSYLGGIDKVIEKMKSTPHSEFIGNKEINEKEVKLSMSSGRDIFNRNNIDISFIEIDNSYPDTIYNNIEKYASLIMSPNV